MNNITLTVAAGWTSLGTGRSTAFIEALGTGVILFIGAVAPISSSPGFTLPSGIPVAPPGIAALGGGLWVRATIQDAGVRHVSA